MSFIKYIRSTSWIIFLLAITSICGDKCPSLSVIQSIHQDIDNSISMFLQIPNTNIVLVHVRLRGGVEPVVYYIDTSTEAGETLSNIKIEYSIASWDVAQNLNQIIVLTGSKIILANIYTFETISSRDQLEATSIKMIKNSKYALVLLWFYNVHLIDTENGLKIISTCDNRFDQTQIGQQQFYMDYVYLNDSSLRFLVSGAQGLFSWTFDLGTLQSYYHGYFQLVGDYSPIRGWSRYSFYPSSQINLLFIVQFSSRIIVVELDASSDQQIVWGEAYIPLQDNFGFENILYQNVDNFSHTLFAISCTYIYVINIEIDFTSKTVTFLNQNNPPSFFASSLYSPYFQEILYVPQGNFILIGDYLAYRYNINTNTIQYYLSKIYFYFSNIADMIYFYLKIKIEFKYQVQQRRFKYELEQDLFISCENSQIKYYTLQNFGVPISNRDLPSSIITTENSIFRVQNCENCIVIKSGSSTIFWTKIFPMSSQIKELDLSYLSLNWSTVGKNLNPYYYKSKIWIVFSLLKSETITDFLFVVVNIDSHYVNYLRVDTPELVDLNFNFSSLAMVSLEYPDNQEIIGVDVDGHIYFWELHPPHSFKNYYSLENCKNPKIGDVFHYNQNKWIFLACDNFNIIQFNKETEKQIIVASLTSIPLVLRIFQNPQIVVFGDYTSGFTYIHKFNPIDQSFSHFITIKPSTITDPIIWIEQLKDGQLWLQYERYNLFFEINACIHDSALCTNCEMDFYFSTNENIDPLSENGIGSKDQPFTNSKNIILSFTKINNYRNIISGAHNIQAVILIDPNYEFKLIQQLLSFPFSSIVSIKFLSSNQDQISIIKYDSQLKLASFRSIEFKDIRLQFELEKLTSPCSLQFDKIDVTLTNFFIEEVKFQKNCYSITFIESNLSLNQMSISNLDFSNNNFVFKMESQAKVSIDQLEIKSCTFGDTTQLFKASSSLSMIIKDIIIEENKCSDLNPSSISIPFFEGGYFNITKGLISRNQFCNKILFSTATSILNENHSFIFSEIVLENNEFDATSENLFFDSLFSMLTIPKHTVIIQNSIFNENYLLSSKIRSSQLEATLIKVHKVANIQLDQVSFTNHSNISFGKLSYSTKVNVNKFNCTNSDQFYLNESFSQNLNGCISLIEAQNTYFSDIIVKNKKIKDNSLIQIINQSFSNTVLSFYSCQIYQISLLQTKSNKYVNPIMISSKENQQITFESCSMNDISLDGLQYGLVQGTTGFWIDNYLGSVQISNSIFKGSLSNSKNGFIFIKSYSIEINSCLFSDSNFSDDLKTNLMEGGQIRAKVVLLTINDSSFSQSVALRGAFLFIEPIQSEISVRISRTLFTEGFALKNGGSFIINSQSSLLNFQCSDCEFENIFTMSNSASSIGLLEFSANLSNKNHEISFLRGKIENIFGLNDNYFLNAKSSNIIFKDISQISSNQISNSNIKSNLFQFFSDNYSQQYGISTLISATTSNLVVENCRIRNLSQQSDSSSNPLLITSNDSNISLFQNTFQDCLFLNSFMKLSGNKVNLEQNYFINLSQISRSSQTLRKLSEEKTPLFSAPSLIILDQLELVSLNNTFNNIICSSCKGSAFQLFFSNFTISSTNCLASLAYQGGCFFIYGAIFKSTIQSSVFSENQSLLDGGALYIKGYKGKELNIEIYDSKIINNQAQNGNGGAIFIHSDQINNSLQIVKIDSTTIKNNTGIVGGGINSSGIPTRIGIDCILSSNEARSFGNNQYSYPTRLRLKNQEQFINSTAFSTYENNQLNISEFRSGSTLNSLQFVIENEFNEELIPLNDEEQSSFFVVVKIDSLSENLSKLDLQGTKSSFYDYENGFQFEGLVFVGVPGSTSRLLFSSSQIKILNQTDYTYFEDYNFEINLTVRDCIPGELVETYGILTQCSPCKEGTYSLDTSNCQLCPDGAYCLGGANITPKPGYWRKDNLSTDINLCENQSANCIGENEGNNSCQTGHIGALCEECDIEGIFWGSRYSKSRKHSCVNCDSISNNILVVVLMTIWSQISISFAIKNDIKRLEEKVGADIIRKNIKKRNPINSILQLDSLSENISILKKSTIKIERNSKKNLKIRLRSGVYIKMLTNYFQIVSSISTFNLSFNTSNSVMGDRFGLNNLLFILGIIDYPQSVGNPVSQTMLSLECALNDVNSNIPIIYLKLLFSAAIPFAYLIIFTVGLVVNHFIYGKKNKFPYYIITTAMMFLIIYVQPDLVTQVIALLSCRKIGNTMYILSNVSYECYTQDYELYSLLLLAPMLVLLVFIIPVSLFLILLKNKEKLNQPIIKLKYGFLYKEYRTEVFYWEFVKMIEKLGIILCLNFYSQNIVTKGILVFIGISLYSFFSSILQPYQENDVNQVDVYSTNTCAITVLLGLFLYKNDIDFLIYPTLILLVTINSWFILQLLKKILSQLFYEIGVKFKWVTDFIIQFFPLIQKLIKDRAQKPNVRPELKRKFKRALSNFINKAATEKRSIIMQIVESQVFNGNISTTIKRPSSEMIRFDQFEEPFCLIQPTIFEELQTETQRSNFTNLTTNRIQEFNFETFESPTRIKLERASKNEIIMATQLEPTTEDKLQQYTEISFNYNPAQTQFQID